MILAKYFFQGYLEDDEKVVAVLHRHPFILAKMLAPILFVGGLLPVFFWYLFPEFWPFFALWMGVSLIRIFREFMIWYHDTILVTTVSLIDVFWNGFFDRSSTRLEYNMMEGVTTEIRGFRRVLFNYGRLSVQRGGGTNPLVLEDAMNPRKGERKIMEYQDEFLNKQNMEDSESLKNLLAQMVRYHSSSEKDKK